jgi:hypothetical protein
MIGDRLRRRLALLAVLAIALGGCTEEKPRIPAYVNRDPMGTAGVDAGRIPEVDSASADSLFRIVERAIPELTLVGDAIERSSNDSVHLMMRVFAQPSERR